ncbi:BA14K family protein [Roseibium denhamense]|uniref:BA14K family protein n=1 Tax=Roseibium denhamense TaxID=76305 RepID=UPI001AD9406A|nr:BA14K family protein [Roseibium denhamense]
MPGIRYSNGLQGQIRFLARGMTGAAAVLSVIAGLFMVSLPASSPAKADSIHIGTNGFGFVVGSRGYRGSFYYGPRYYYGRPYRPYAGRYYYPRYHGPVYPYRYRVYVNPPRYHGQPQRVPYTKTGLAPFTPQWVAYCSRKFKSFNPNTGMYLAYSGKYRFCR